MEAQNQEEESDRSRILAMGLGGLNMCLWFCYRSTCVCLVHVIGWRIFYECVAYLQLDCSASLDATAAVVIYRRCCTQASQRGAE